MGYLNLAEALADLERAGQLRRIDAEVDPCLEAGVIQRRACAAGGPALLFTRVRGTRFPLLANLFGTMPRTRFLFRDTLRSLEALFALKADPMELLRRPWRYAGVPRAAWNTRPKPVADGPVLAGRCALSDLPQVKSWPKDGGAYVTLPQVYTEDPDRPGFSRSNLGMYRVQISGNDFLPDREAGLHYQIHRGIGPHHAAALSRGEDLKVNVFVGGPPALTLAAVMPLPEGLAEILFAGALGGRRVRMVRRPGLLPILAEADFCISGRVRPGQVKPEGPFGDHLGYYSLAHPFPVLEVDAVHHRPDAVWPFTTVGRPPQEDTVFGAFIHELVKDLAPTVFPGVHEVHAVDAAGVHPLLLAVGSERYVPFAAERQPQELLTNAMALLGSTQTALSKYVCIAAREDAPALSAHDVPGFFRHLLERIDLTRDVHFLTRTTMDTLDYSGISLNQGSKAVLAAAGKPRRTLGAQVPALPGLPPGFGAARVFAPGILVLAGPPHGRGRDETDSAMEELCRCLEGTPGLEAFPLVVVADNAEFTAANWNNFLWVAFTRSDPATDSYGPGAHAHAKHWVFPTCLVLDARLKAHHAPALTPAPEVERRVDALAAPGGPLHGLF
jgi:4-hydroxy-3-polyprenylbenzoate decarboxylase